MIEWNDEGYLLAARPHGEDAAVLQVLTREHGRHAGLVRGGQSRRMKGVLQPGNLLRVTWRARLADHLGNYTVELLSAHSAGHLGDADRLAALSAAAAICERSLPEREAHPACFAGFGALIEALDGEHWAEIYVKWELSLLAELGFGVDLSGCAAGGKAEDLVYVSPKSGRAVSAEMGEPYRDKLLSLPGFLAGRGGGGPEEVAQGLTLSGYFLERNIFHPQDRPLPPARERLAERFRRRSSAAQT